MPEPRLWVPPRYRDAVVNMAPVSYWRLNEAAGTRAIDQMGRNNATYTGTLGQGKPGPMNDGAAVTLTTGGSDYVDCGAPAFPQAAYTLACWEYASGNTQDKGVIGKWGSAVLWWDSVNVNVPALVHTTTVGNFYRPTVTISVGVWHFWVGTWDGATLRLYIDGKQIGSGKAMVTAPGTAAYNFVVGTYANTSFIMAGSLAEAAYWSRAISLADQAYLYAVGTGR